MVCFQNPKPSLPKLNNFIPKLNNFMMQNSCPVITPNQSKKHPTSMQNRSNNHPTSMQNQSTIIQIEPKNEKGDFMKMSVSPTRNTHFHGFRTCFWRVKWEYKWIYSVFRFFLFCHTFFKFFYRLWLPKSFPETMKMSVSCMRNAHFHKIALSPKFCQNTFHIGSKSMNNPWTMSSEIDVKQWVES